MREYSQRFRSTVVAVAILVAGVGSINAQTGPEERTGSRFLSTKNHVLNLDHIDHIDFGVTGDGSHPTAQVFFAANKHPVVLVGKEAEQLRAGLEGNPSGHAGDGKGEPDGIRFLAFDDFDGRLGLNWKPVRPDPSHVSLTKEPGKLTITTQRGSIHGEELKDPFGEGIQAKNLYLIDNPLAEGRRLGRDHLRQRVHPRDAVPAGGADRLQRR